MKRSQTLWAELCASASMLVSPALASGAVSTVAPDMPVAYDDLNARLTALEDGIAALKRQRSQDGWLTREHSRMVRSLIHEILEDASLRPAGMQPALAGWRDGPGFFLQSSDSRHTMHVQGQIQFRHVLNLQEDPPGPIIGPLAPGNSCSQKRSAGGIFDHSDDSRAGFAHARMKLRLTGNIRDPQWLYLVEGSFASAGGAMTLDDGWIAHVFNDPNGTVFVGQFKLPLLREELVGSGFQQAAERSVINERFTAGRGQGVLLDYRTSHVHGSFAASDGAEMTGGANAPALGRDTEFALTARGEILLAGAWEQFEDISSWPGEDKALMLGGAMHIERGEYGTAIDELGLFEWTIDASLELGGANVFTYVAGRRMRGALHADQYAAVIQAGLFLCENWEVFGRYEWGDLDRGGGDLSIITVGATRYIAGHQLKWTTDVGLGLNDISHQWVSGLSGGFLSNDATGWRRDSRGKEGQIVIRSQLQLLF